MAVMLDVSQLPSPARSVRLLHPLNMAWVVVTLDVSHLARAVVPVNCSLFLKRSRMLVTKLTSHVSMEPYASPGQTPPTGSTARQAFTASRMLSSVSCANAGTTKPKANSSGTMRVGRACLPCE